jgi:hypothetical protein
VAVWRASGPVCGMCVYGVCMSVSVCLCVNALELFVPSHSMMAPLRAIDFESECPAQSGTPGKYPSVLCVGHCFHPFRAAVHRIRSVCVCVCVCVCVF